MQHGTTLQGTFDQGLWQIYNKEAIASFIAITEPSLLLVHH